MDGMKKLWKNEHSSLRVVKSEALPAHLSEIREVVDVFTEPKSRNKGFASSLLGEVCKAADKCRTVMIVIPKPFGSSKGLGDLEPWYSKFGFVRLQDSPVIMMREPSHG